MSFLRFYLVCIFVAVVCFSGLTQRISGGFYYDFFFDNAEFDRSGLATSQTLGGMHIVPELKFELDKNTFIATGVNFLFAHGNNPHLTALLPLVYLRNETKKQQLWVGAFSRTSTLNEYSELLFLESIRYFRPNVSGFMWQLRERKGFLKLWLDWTGMQRADMRESFLAGLSFLLPVNESINLSGESYLFHLANTRPATPGFVVCDNAQAEFRLSWDSKTGHIGNRMNLSAGMLAAYERERGNPAGSAFPVSFVLRANYFTKLFSFENVLVYGKPRLLHYEKYAETLYWSSPFLRDKSYFKSKLYFHLIRRTNWNLTAGSQVHLSQGQLHFQQMLTVSAAIDRITLVK